MEKKLMFSAKNIKKSYVGTEALKGVDLEIYEGEIVGVIGENGAGKSTLLKIIIGMEQMTSGEMKIYGKPYSPKSPKDANASGIGMVFQEQALIVNLTVAQNIFLGYENKYRRYGFINWRQMYRDADEVLANIGCEHINSRKKVFNYDFATRQMIEISKVINIIKSSGNEHCLILLDEPTSVLNEEEVKKLFVELRKLKAMGHSIVFVSHRLDEVMEISDRIYVYKDGENAGNMETEKADEAMLYRMMVGRSTTTQYYKLEKQREPEQKVVLEVRNLGLKGVFKNVSFKLYQGEILGLCGVVGSGKEDICSVLCGDEKPTEGQIFIKGKEVKFSNCADALKASVLMIPKERLSEGIVDGLSVEENIALSNLELLRNRLLISRKRLGEQADEWIEKLRIKTPGRKQLLMQLSGGNQQKVVFARALSSECEILILNHPTRGVDVGAKEEIYTLIREMANQGKSIILLGDTLDESIGMSNRIIVMKDGLITGEFDASVDRKPSQVDVVSLMM